MEVHNFLLNFLVLGDSGVIGGTMSHEYQFKTNIGEDTLVHCQNCNFTANVETYKSQSCPKCNESVKLDVQSGIEVFWYSFANVYAQFSVFRLGIHFSSAIDIQNH